MTCATKTFFTQAACIGTFHTWEETIASELLKTVITLFPEPAVCGENVTHDTDFEFVKSEMGKLGAIDWQKVEETAIRITREKSKDLRVLCFLSYVLFRQEKWTEWVDVMDGICQLSTTRWELFQPDRDRAKQLSFKWLSETRYQDSLAEKKPPESAYEDLKRLVEVLNSLKPVLEEKFPDGSPFPGAILSFAQKWESALKPKPKPAQPAPETAGSAGAVASTTPSGGGGPAEPMDTPKQAQMTAKKAALFLIEKEPLRPMGYRLSRCLRWDLLDKAPPVSEGKTQLPPPAVEQRTYFQNLVGKSDWAAALPAVEKAFTAGANHVWLDLQRIASQACTNLNGYQAVKEAILFETALFYKKIPELAQLSFSDGSAFCDDATRDWLENEVKSSLGSSEGGASRGGSHTDPVEKERNESNQLIAAGKFDAAINLLQNALRLGGTERDSFRRSQLLAQALLSAKRPDIAVSLLESLDEKIERHHLDRWDPDLAVEVWSTMVRAFKAMIPSKPQNIQSTLLEKQNSILTKLSRTNPMSAFSIHP